MRGIKPVHIMAHPNFYAAMEKLNKEFKEKNGINLSQSQQTYILSQNLRKIRMPDIYKGGKNVKKKKR